MMNDQNGGHFPWRLFVSEIAGTALQELFPKGGLQDVNAVALSETEALE